MSSFTSNYNTRSSKRAKTQGFRTAQELMTGVVNSRTVLDPGNPQLRPTRRQTKTQSTVIGSQESRGLVIRGPMQYDPDRDLALEQYEGFEREREERKPSYNITHSGIGVLKFPQPIRIPAIEGNVGISGDVHIAGKITADEGLSGGGGSNSTYQYLENWGNLNLTVDGGTNATLSASVIEYHFENRLCTYTIGLAYTFPAYVADAEKVVNITGIPFNIRPGDKYPLSVDQQGIFKLNHAGASATGEMVYGGGPLFTSILLSQTNYNDPAAFLVRVKDMTETGTLIVSGHAFATSVYEAP